MDIANPHLDYERAVDFVFTRLKSPLEAIQKLLVGRELFKQAVKLEVQNPNRTILWRFHTFTADSLFRADIRTLSKSGQSFAYSLLSGWVNDGFTNCDFEQGLTNYSACTYASWNIHIQGLERKDEFLRATKNDNYISYLENLPFHSLYALVLSDEKIIEFGKTLILPSGSFAGFGSFAFQVFDVGEDFHPKIWIRPDSHPSVSDVITQSLAESHVLYIDNRVIESQRDSEVIKAKDVFNMGGLVGE